MLAGGEEIDAPVVASNITPTLTFLKLLDEKVLPPEFVAQMKRYRCEGTSCKINLALSGLPKFRAHPETPGPQHRASLRSNIPSSL